MTTSATYDFNTGAVKTATDENSQTTEVTYNTDNMRVTRVDSPNDAYSETEYNDTTFPYHVKSTVSLDSTREVSSWSFSNGRGQNFMNRSQTSDGYLSSDVEFDNMGRAIKSYNPYTVSGLTTARPSSGILFTHITGRDGLGRTLETTLPDNTTVTASYSGIVATVTDQAGKMRRQKADALGRIVRVDEPNSSGVLGDVGTPNQPTHYEYDGNDNLTKVTQSDGTVTQERLFKYDSLSRLTHERQVEASPTLTDAGVKASPTPTQWTGVYKYNTDNLLEWGVDARGVKTTFDYDGLNRIESVTYTGETGYQTPTMTYTYDQTESGFYNNNRLTKVQTAANTTYGIPETIHNFRYDKVGQVKKQTTSIGSESYLQEYGYNLAGQLTSQKYPSGKVVTNTIDNLGRLSTVADGTRTLLSAVTFNDKGLLSQMNLGNGNHETFLYNDRFQMTSQSLMKGSTVMQKYDYSYGTIADLSNGTVDTTKNNGQLSKVEGFIGANKQWSQRFGYDELGRLKEAREYKGATTDLSYKQVFDFDRFGNLYRKAANNATTGQEDPLAYTPIETSDINRATNRFATDTTYNEAGMVTADDKFRDMGFAYDANGRMVKATKASVADAWTVYDALGNRVAAKVNDVWRFMIYDAFGKLVAEYGQAEEGVGGVSYLQQDWQGSVRTVSNSNGYVISRIDHSAFGEAVGAAVGLRSTAQGYWGTTATRQGYGLTEKDEATGLDHTWFRKNEGSAGRWTSPDPYKGSMQLGDPQTFNRYSYVGSQPTNFVDPSGLARICITFEVEECEPLNMFQGGSQNCVSYDVQICFETGGWPGGPPTSGGGGGGGSATPAPQQPDKKRCKQSRTGSDADAIREQQRRAGISDLIIDPGQDRSPNSPEGLLGYTMNRDVLLQRLSSNNAFLYDTGLGGLHNADIGLGGIDSRSRVLSGPGFGLDIRGMNSSLQVVVGQTNPRTGVAPVYSDLDCINPDEGLAPLIGHGLQIAFKKIGRWFR